MTAHITRTGPGNRPGRQRGVISTVIAVIVLLITLMAAVALMRSVDTGNSIAGRLGFKQQVTQEAELAYQDAVAGAAAYLGQAGEADKADIGYYATPQASDARGIPTALIASTAGKRLQAPDTKDDIRYTVERLCPQAGPALTVAPNACLVPAATINGGSTSGNQGGFGSGAQAAYRLTVRVEGPKHAVSYVQTIMR
ncbi:Tfp pilus assembly protein PilX [Dyella sp. SG562]|jgi:hypothetical protein|uniref:pilus assembly PilX family protein n=1 Tax=unclassified Dyella TaxID=2634549 RepID=UPI0014211B9F|nr:MULTISPECIES: hypothetical protein [unclassified Dyella]NII74124.1 Tfp pilus assembly protein PilX [Dyella sp. SG562]NKJ20206.1 Tfp pilus assembly protein PilX [Dyella sp. SG609]